MRRYIPIVRKNYSEDIDFMMFPMPTTITVHEEASEPSPTGLLDMNGNEIYSFSQKEPIGFVHWDFEE